MTDKVEIKEDILDEKEFDINFIDDIKKYGGEDITICYQCGQCTGVCPSSKKTTYKTRKLIKMASFGLKERLLSMPWLCATCHRCDDVCPANIKVSDVIVAFRHVSAREKRLPPYIKGASVNIIKYGQNIEPNEDIQRLRRQLGLEPVPSTMPYYKDVLKEIKILIKATKYDKLLGIEKEVEA